MDQFKAAHAIDTKFRTLTEAIKGADCVLGLSVAGAISKDMVKSMAETPDHFRHGQSRSRDHAGRRA